MLLVKNKLDLRFYFMSAIAILRYNYFQRSHLNKMPVNPSLYPDNWKKLALAVKRSKNWCCECCGKKCYRPGEKPDDLTRSEWTADILQVHHKNHDTNDNRLSNLVESREGINLRPSLLDPYVRFSSHTAPDILSFCFS